MGGILSSLTSLCLSFLYGNGFLSRGFIDRRQNLHVGSATSPAGLLPFWGDSPRDGLIFYVNRGPYGTICFLLKHFLLVYFLYLSNVYIIF